jgi:hypothetical protein
MVSVRERTIPTERPPLIMQHYKCNFEILTAKFNVNGICTVTVRGGPEACETSKFLHFLDNRLADGGEVVSLVLISESNHVHSAAGRIRYVENKIK